jgi:tetratricopeptide (TPR) repeat protein
LKLVRRNKALTAAVAAVLVSLVAGLIGTSVGRVAALRAKGEAEAVTDYLNSVFAVANPYRQGRDITVVEQLEEAGARIDRDLSDRPTVEANVRLAIARTYVGMWMWPEAVPHLRRALVLKRELHGPDDPRVAEIMSLLGRSLAFLREPESIPIQEEALRIRERSFGTEHGLVAESRASLGFAIWQTHPERTRESIPMYRDALAMYDRVGLGRHADVGRFTFGLAMMLASVGEADEADVAFRKAISVYTGLGEGHDRYLVECMNRYAHFLVYRAQYDEAEAALLESIELTPDSDGATGPTAPARILSAIHYGRGDHRGAAQSAQTAMVAELRLLASRTSHDDGDIPQLLERIRSAPEVSPSGLAEGFAILAAHSDIVRNGHDRWMIDVSHILAECDSAPSAVAIMETCLKACQGRSPAEPWRVARAQEVLGSHLVRLGRYAEAEHHLAESVNGLRAHFGPDHALTRLAVERMKELYEAWGKPEQAAAFGSSSPVESEPRDPS